MWSHERRSRILSELESNGKIRTAGLAAAMSVSRETIRRDLLELETEGVLERVHGGAIISSGTVPPEPTFAERIVAHQEDKQAIGRLAAELIEPNSTIFVDAGSTTLAFGQEIVRLGRPLRIITNSIGIAQLTCDHEFLETLLLGGTPHSEVPATYGELTLAEIERFVADYAVISPVGYSSLRGPSDYALHEAEIARKMIRSSRKCLLLCHSEKLETDSRVSICPSDEVDFLITDEGAPANLTLPRGEVRRARTFAMLAPRRAGH